MHHIVIAAGTFREAQIFSLQHEIPIERWTWIFEPAQLLGRSPAHTIVFCVGSWQETKLGKHPSFAKFMHNSVTSKQFAHKLTNE